MGKQPSLKLKSALKVCQTNIEIYPNLSNTFKYTIQQRTKYKAAAGPAGPPPPLSISYILVIVVYFGYIWIYLHLFGGMFLVGCAGWMGAAER